MSWSRAFHLACTSHAWPGAIAPHLRNPVKLGTLAVCADELTGGDTLFLPVRQARDDNSVFDVWETFSDTDFLAVWTTPSGDPLPYYYDENDEGVFTPDPGGFAYCFEQIVARPGVWMSPEGSALRIYYAESLGFRLVLENGEIHRAAFPARFARMRWVLSA